MNKMFVVVTAAVLLVGCGGAKENKESAAPMATPTQINDVAFLHAVDDLLLASWMPADTCKYMSSLTDQNAFEVIKATTDAAGAGQWHTVSSEDKQIIGATVKQECAKISR